MHRAVLVGGIATAVAVAGYIAYQQINRPAFALEVDATKDTTDIGIMYRIRTTNVGTQQLTGIIVELGTNDIQEKSFLDPGQSYYFYPDPETQVSTVRSGQMKGSRSKVTTARPPKSLACRVPADNINEK